MIATALQATADLAQEPDRVFRFLSNLGPCDSGSRVTLSAEVVRASLLDRAVLRLGGRRYLARGLHDAVSRLRELA